MADPTQPTPAAADAAPTPGALFKLTAFSLAILGALPASGLLDTWPWAYKLAGLVVVGLAAVGYQNHTVTLKRAHAAGKASGEATKDGDL